MKKIFTLLSAISFGSVMGQTYIDNFDSYTAGGFVAQQSAGLWTTWSNAPGGPEDAIVSVTQALSGANSAYFSSTAAAGGPDDLVMRFGSTSLVSGQFDLSMDLFVETGKAGYFNLQGTQTLGGEYAIDAFFKDNGTFVISNGIDGDLLTSVYPAGAWFEFKLEAGLTLNNWVVKINGSVVGNFHNSINKIAAIDIFPIDADAPFNSSFYVDNFSAIYTPYTPVALDAAVINVFKSGANVVGLSAKANTTIRNIGNTPITGYTVTYNYNGVSIPQVITGVNIAYLASLNHIAPQNIVLAAGTFPLTATITNVNGAGDPVTTNNTLVVQITPIIPAAGKVVVAEEGTGTWCQWCPRGAVFMEKFTNDYQQLFAGIAVHNADPMVETSYDAGIGALVSGYPSLLVDRGASADPSLGEAKILSQLLIAPHGGFDIGAVYNSVSRELNISVKTTFTQAGTGSYKLALVLTEDKVRGTTSQYNQQNSYAGGANGVMGGYELLANPVPASIMVYDHVARVIQPSFAGSAVYGNVQTVGQIFQNNFTITLPATWKDTSIHIVPMLILPNGKIDNGGSASIAEAVANGYLVGLSEMISGNQAGPDDQLKIYPNPASGSVNITVLGNNESTVEIFNALGQKIEELTFNGTSTITKNISTYQSGLYIVTCTTSNGVTSKRFVVE